MAVGVENRSGSQVPPARGGAVTTLSIEAFKPARVPTGYSFRRRVQGSASPGFTGPTGEELADQVTLIHTTANTYASWRSPMTVHVVARPDARLFAAETHKGVALDLGLAGVTSAVYHDGWWGPAPDGSGGKVWDTANMHSLTLRTATHTVAVRAAKSVPLDELAAVAKSIPLGS
jgi:hypothetical protein